MSRTLKLMLFVFLVVGCITTAIADEWVISDFLGEKIEDVLEKINVEPAQIWKPQFYIKQTDSNEVIWLYQSSLSEEQNRRLQTIGEITIYSFDNNEVLGIPDTHMILATGEDGRIINIWYSFCEKVKTNNYTYVLGYNSKEAAEMAYAIVENMTSDKLGAPISAMTKEWEPGFIVGLNEWRIQKGVIRYMTEVTGYGNPSIVNLKNAQWKVNVNEQSAVVELSYNQLTTWLGTITYTVNMSSYFE